MGMKRSSLDGKGEMRSYQSWDSSVKPSRSFNSGIRKRSTSSSWGLNLGGHDGAHPTVFPLEPAHGGEAGFRRMMERLNRPATARRSISTTRTRTSARPTGRRRPSSQPSTATCDSTGMDRRLLLPAIPQEMLERFGKRDLPRLRDLGLRGMHYWMRACR